MISARLKVLAVLAAATASQIAHAYEVNAWPAAVIQKDPSGGTQSLSSLGPLLFSKPSPGPDAGRACGFRPFYVKWTGGDSTKTDILYPLFFYRQYPDSYKWSIFQLINGEGLDPGAINSGTPEDKHLDVWPFYFSRVTKDPSDTYHALLPIYGTIKERLGFDRLFWAPFPIYVDTFRKETRTVYVPWPFVRIVSGAAHGFGIWPLFGSTKGPGAESHSFYLWPFIWNNTSEAARDAPDGSVLPTHFGILPLYTRDTAPGQISENYLWPFFGYTEDTLPYRYSEQRYFWPFVVKGRGERENRDRFGPFYTHSNVNGTESTWVMWPFWHKTTWDDGDVAQAKTQFFYFLYWSLDQSIPERPSIAHAYKRHIWPFVSIWDNGAGSRQVQAPSLCEVFFPDNPDMRETWTPLFALYRRDHRPTGETRNSILWSAVTWRRDDAGRLAEFHMGPLFGMRRRPAGESWSIFGFDLESKRAKMDQLTSR